MRRQVDPNDKAMNRELGRRLRGAREGANFTQVELAAAIDCDYQTIQKYENGKTRIPCSRVIVIAQVLNMPISVFFDNLIEIARAPANVGPWGAISQHKTQAPSRDYQSGESP